MVFGPLGSNPLGAGPLGPDVAGGSVGQTFNVAASAQSSPISILASIKAIASNNSATALGSSLFRRDLTKYVPTATITQVASLTLGRALGRTHQATTGSGGTSTTYTEFLKTSGTWTCPSGVTSIKIEAIGRGGTASYDGNVGTGGSGGSYACLNSFSVSSGSSYGYTVGVDAYFDSTSTVLAAGGGSLATSVGDVVHVGGSGGLRIKSSGAGGGGAGGPDGNGLDGSGATAGSANGGVSKVWTCNTGTYSGETASPGAGDASPYGGGSNGFDGDPGGPSIIILTYTTVGSGSIASLSSLKAIGQTVNAVTAPTRSLVREVGKALTRLVSPTPSIMRASTKSFASTGMTIQTLTRELSRKLQSGTTVIASMSRAFSISKTIQAATSSLASINRGITKFLSGTGTTLRSLMRATSWQRSAASSTIARINRAAPLRINKTVMVASTVGVLQSITVAINASAATARSLLHTLGKNLSALAQRTTSLNRSTNRVLIASPGRVASLGRSVPHTIGALAGRLVSMTTTKSFGRTVQATSAITASLRRLFGKNFFGEATTTKVVSRATAHVISATTSPMGAIERASVRFFGTIGTLLASSRRAAARTLYGSANAISRLDHMVSKMIAAGVQIVVSRLRTIEKHQQATTAPAAILDYLLKIRRAIVRFFVIS